MLICENCKKETDVRYLTGSLHVCAKCRLDDLKPTSVILSSITNCAGCDKVMIHSKNDYCSKECFLQSKRITLQCKGCDSQFQVLLCHKDRQYCSRKCWNTSVKPKRNSVIVCCSWCGKSSDRQKSTVRAHANTFCNKECYAEFHSRLMIDVECQECKKIFTKNQNTNSKYCSRECYKKAYVPHNFANVDVIKGWFASNKAGNVHYDSSFELKRFKELDYDPSVITWNRCDDKIEWFDDAGKSHFYHPDLTIKYEKMIVVEELKGFINGETQRKIKAATDFYDSCGIIFRVLYQKEHTSLEHFVEYYENSMGVFHRPRYECIWINAAMTFAERSTCNRLSVGALVVDANNERVLCFGYNGSHAGGENGCDTLEPGKCGCIHAETNALAKATEPLDGCTLYVTTAPCFSCSKLIINRRIKRVVYLKAYRDVSGIRLLRKFDVEVQRYSDLIDFEVENT
jgi:dCMP deaminase